MKEMIWRHYKSEALPDGRTRYTGEIEYEDHYAVEKYDENSLVFFLNGVQSKPIKIVYDREFSWKAQKTQIKSAHSVDKLLEYLQDNFWDGYTYNMACKYCRA